MALDRSHRAVAWKTLQGVLPCGALLSFTALRQPNRADTQPLIAQAICPHCLPLSVPETLTHMLLECPVAITVWDWICRLWAAYSAAQAPPATAAVLLTGYQREWTPPPQDLQASWLQLRIAAIAALSSGARSRRQGLPIGAASVASTVVHAVRTAVGRGW